MLTITWAFSELLSFCWKRVWDTATVTKPWPRDTQWVGAHGCPWENGANRRAWRRAAETFKPQQYLGSATKQSTMRSGLPIQTMWLHFCDTLFMSERKKIEDEAAPHSMWTLLSKMLTVRLPTCQSHGPPLALGHPLSLCVTACSWTHRTPPCFLESFSKVISSPQSPNQHSLRAQF